jgi:hypothetical protein
MLSIINTRYYKKNGKSMKITVAKTPSGKIVRKIESLKKRSKKRSSKKRSSKRKSKKRLSKKRSRH